MIFDRHANLKYKYGNRHFWCKGYYADTVGKNKCGWRKHSVVLKPRSASRKVF